MGLGYEKKRYRERNLVRISILKSPVIKTKTFEKVNVCYHRVKFNRMNFPITKPSVVVIRFFRRRECE